MSDEFKLAKSMAVFRTTRIIIDDLHDITNSELSILTLINNCECDISAVDICNHFGFSKPYATKVIKRLMEIGLLESYKAQYDGRKNLLKTTDKGKVVVGLQMNKYQQTVNYIYEKFGVKKVKEFVELLDEAVLLIKEYNDIHK